MMMGKKDTLPTIWEVPDDLWEQIHPLILEMDPPRTTGRKRVDPRRMLDGIVFRMRSGCSGTACPGNWETTAPPPHFQRWVELGVLERVWGVLVEECDELGGVEWEWQSADCAMGKARFGGVQSVPNPRTGPRQAASGASWLTGAVAR